MQETAIYFVIKSLAFLMLFSFYIFEVPCMSFFIFFLPMRHHSGESRQSQQETSRCPSFFFSFVFLEVVPQ